MLLKINPALIEGSGTSTEHEPHTEVITGVYSGRITSSPAGKPGVTGGSCEASSSVSLDVSCFYLTLSKQSVHYTCFCNDTKLGVSAL